VASESRKEINRGVVLQLLRDGHHPSAQRVLASGGRGAQADVLKDIRETLVELVNNLERPDIPEEILTLTRKVVDIAWDKLGPYRREADEAVAAAKEAVSVAQLERSAALEQLDTTVQQLDDLRRQLESTKKALAAAEGKGVQLESDRQALAARYEQLKEFSEQRAAEAEAFKADVVRAQEARSREHAEAVANLKRDQAETLAAEHARFQEMEARYQTAIKELKEEHRQREALAAGREAALRKEAEVVSASLHQVERELAAAQAAGQQLTQQNADLRGGSARQQEESEVLRSELQQAMVTRAALEAEVRLLREQIKNIAKSGG
jgi:chromosome segregation ATPase